MPLNWTELKHNNNSFISAMYILHIKNTKRVNLLIYSYAHIFKFAYEIIKNTDLGDKTQTLKFKHMHTSVMSNSLWSVHIDV